jgi:cobalt-precorrin-5B (C1)-methyltransferase
MDLHSGRSEVNIAALAGHLSDLGGAPEIVAKARAAATAGAVLAAAGDLPLGDRVAAEALGVVRHRLQGTDIEVDVTIFDRSGKLIGHAGP